jgi:hypothetical protein
MSTPKRKNTIKRAPCCEQGALRYSGAPSRSADSARNSRKPAHADSEAHTRAQPGTPSNRPTSRPSHSPASASHHPKGPYPVTPDANPIASQECPQTLGNAKHFEKTRNTAKKLKQHVPRYTTPPSARSAPPPCTGEKNKNNITGPRTEFTLQSKPNTAPVQGRHTARSHAPRASPPGQQATRTGEAGPAGTRPPAAEHQGFRSASQLEPSPPTGRGAIAAARSLHPPRRPRRGRPATALEPQPSTTARPASTGCPAP